MIARLKYNHSKILPICFLQYQIVTSPLSIMSTLHNYCLKCKIKSEPKIIAIEVEVLSKM